VIDCTFIGLSQYAVQNYGWNNSHIRDNRVDACGAGIKVRVIDSTDTEDTKDASGTQTSKSQSIYGGSISGNIIVNCTGFDHVIVIQGEAVGQVGDAYVNFHKVTGNDINGNSGSSNNGIRANFARGTVVEGNGVHSTVGAAIFFQNHIGSTIEGNEIQDISQGSGVSCDNGSALGNNGLLIEGNRIYNVGQNGVQVQGGTSFQIIGNNVIAAGQQTTNTYFGIRISTSATYGTISGNRVRRGGGTPQVANAINATNTTSFLKSFGNDTRDSGAVGTAVVYSGASQDNTSADV
jgi:hypothetical protein